MTPEQLKAALRSSLRMAPKLDEAAAFAAQKRGNQAAELLRNEAFTDALKDVEEVYMRAWRNSLGTDIDLRERAHIAISLLADIKNLLVDRVRSGQVSTEKLASSLRG